MVTIDAQMIAPRRAARTRTLGELVIKVI